MEGPGVTVTCAHVRGDGPPLGYGPWQTRGRVRTFLFFPYPAGVGAPRVWGLPAWAPEWPKCLASSQQ